VKTTITLLLLLGPTVSASTPPDDEVAAVVEAFRRPASPAKRAAFVDDATLYRRLSLDLTGRLPEPEDVSRFVADRDPDKRLRLIDALIESEAFTDRLTTFLEDLFRLRRIFENGLYRNPFHDLIREMVAENRPWDEMARTLLTSAGLGNQREAAFIFWAFESLEEDFRLDFLDDQVGYITETMLGLRTTCISCHDGAYHLEAVNVGLAKRKRTDFWGLAAFFSQTFVYYDLTYGPPEEDTLIYERIGITDGDAPDHDPLTTYLIADDGFLDGEYHAQSEPGEGMRPPRNGGTIAPVYLNGEGPRPGETRREAFARLLTSDRQFARNMVNRMWAHFFGEGFVMPLDDWDLGRIDAATAKANNTSVQARDPHLMEYLTDRFIESGYDLRALAGALVGSWVYRVDYGERAPIRAKALGHWMGETRVHRLEAEAILDAINDTLEIPAKYVIAGRPYETRSSAWQLPGTDEPAIAALLDETGEFRVDPRLLGYLSEETYYLFQYSARSLLYKLGRGDAFLGKPRDNESGVTRALSLMNSVEANYWIEYWPYFSPYLQRTIAALEAGSLSHEALVDELAFRFLFRAPTASERAALGVALDTEAPDQGLLDAVWLLINHPDFLYTR